ncbi:MAG: hypothetical protein J6K22_03300 [Spirochaetaceae bacterium]|nr:hypothetical protein [Spirochaetaceae bacterium]
MTKEAFIEKISPILANKQFIGWSLEDKVFAISNNLTDDERDLFYELFKQYSIIKFDQYVSLFFSLLQKLDSCISSKIKRIFFLPIIDIENPNKQKSGHFLFSFLDSLEFYQKSFFVNTKINLEIQIEKAKLTDIFVFIDDFIGSGNQALAHVQQEMQKYKLKPNQVYIICFAIMSVGYDLLTNCGFNIVYLNKYNKSISENMEVSVRDKYLGILDSMEKRFNVPDDYQRGYGKCEGAISLKKTPNNTLPIFWYDNFSKKPIFPRKKK